MAARDRDSSEFSIIMSLLKKDERLSVKRFAAVPALLNLPAIQRAPASVSNVSSFTRPGVQDNVDSSEGCLVTKCVRYTHQLVYWVNAVQDEDPADIEVFIEDMGIIPYQQFYLHHTCNLTYLEPFVHTSLDICAFIAVTASSSTLDDLIAMVRADNDHRQQEIDRDGVASYRTIDFTIPSIVDPDYELVALHPEHFLPDNTALTVYDRTTRTSKNYFPASDRCLRESIDPHSPRLPPFRHIPKDRTPLNRLNVFLVILNAEIKFRRYLEMVRLNPPTTPLPDDVIALMNRTVELGNLLYWMPVPTKGSAGERMVASWNNNGRERAIQPDPAKNIEGGSGGERGMEQDTLWLPPMSPRRRRRWFAEMDPATRRAYGTALMCGHDRDYDPALFENAFPVNYVPNLYSKNENVKAWTQNVTPDHSNEGL